MTWRGGSWKSRNALVWRAGGHILGRARRYAMRPRGETAGDSVLFMPPHPESWLRVTSQGLFCEPGGFFIDPVRPVGRAVITHGHADHARPGHDAVLATPET